MVLETPRQLPLSSGIAVRQNGGMIAAVDWRARAASEKRRVL